ncbi:MAG: NUDIX domain-containing protein [Simkania sp.]|nr:NUDIX domain-containing protein [Simkania sp.]
MTERHFTVTTYIFHEGSTLLVHHPKFQKWMPPGGHLEKNETPPEGAKREVLEETGLHVEFLPQESLRLHTPQVTHLERPHFCLLEKIPPFGSTPAHEHIDMIFLAKPTSLTIVSDPAHSNRWFNWDEIQALEIGRDIFEDAYQILHHVMNSSK